MVKFNLLNSKVADEKKAIAKYVNRWGKTRYMVNINKWNTCITCFNDIHKYGETKEESIIKIIDTLYNYKEAKTYICHNVTHNPEQYAEI